MRIKLLLGLCLLTANASAQAQGTLFKMAPDALKSKVIIFEAGKGWNLISETASQIVLARPMSGLGGFLTSTLQSPPACSDLQPRILKTFTLLGTDEGTVLLTREDMERAGPFCRPVQTRWDTDKKTKRQEDEVTQQMKLEFEKVAVPAEQQIAPIPVVASIPVADSTPTPAVQPEVKAVSASQTESLGDVARRYKAQKEQQRSTGQPPPAPAPQNH